MRELGVALIGGGFMGRAHSLAYALAGISANIGAVIHKRVLADVNADLAEKQAAALGWEGWSDDWTAVISRDDVDIVDICTPPQFHEEIALKAIAVGKHIFCEKPISNDLKAAERMARAAEQAGVTTQVGFNYRHTPAVGFAKQIIDVGRIGHPTQVRASYTQESAFGADSKRWRASKVTGGSGAVGDIGSHIIDMTQLLFGDIVRVCGLLRSWAGDGGQGWLLESERLSKDLVDDAGVWLAEFANGAIGSFAVNFFSSGRKNRIHTEFDGTLGAIEFDWNAREEFRVSYVDEEPDHMGFRTIHTNDKHPNGWWRLAGLGTGYPDISAIQMQEFIRAILAGTPGTPDFAAAAQVQRVVEAIAASAVSGQWVEVDRN